MTPQQLNNLAKLLMEWWHMWVIGSHIKQMMWLFIQAKRSPPTIIAKRSSVVKCGFVYSFHFTLRRRAFMMFFCLISSRNFTLNIIHVSTNKFLLVESNNTHVRFFSGIADLGKGYRGVVYDFIESVVLIGWIMSRAYVIGYILYNMRVKLLLTTSSNK